MRKILLVLAFSLLLASSGCTLLGTNSCTKDRTYAGALIVPGAPYTVSYPTSPPIFENRTGRSDGTISVPSHGLPCTQLIVIALTNSNLALSASPATVYLPSPPATATITGQSFDTTYDMPRVEYFDSNGYLVGSVYANSVSGDGTSLEANMPDLSNVYTGTYQIRVTNKTSDGYYTHTVGTAAMSGWGRDRTDSDGDGWYDDEDCAPYDPSFNSSCTNTCGGTGNDPLVICNEQPY
jgi:hypothetical protein